MLFPFLLFELYPGLVLETGKWLDITSHTRHKQILLRMILSIASPIATIQGVLTLTSNIFGHKPTKYRTKIHRSILAHYLIMNIVIEYTIQTMVPDHASNDNRWNIRIKSWQCYSKLRTMSLTYHFHNVIFPNMKTKVLFFAQKTLVKNGQHQLQVGTLVL